jgi:hypothetical protein
MHIYLQRSRLIGSIIPIKTENVEISKTIGYVAKLCTLTAPCCIVHTRARRVHAPQAPSSFFSLSLLSHAPLAHDAFQDRRQYDRNVFV